MFGKKKEEVIDMAQKPAQEVVNEQSNLLKEAEEQQPQTSWKQNETEVKVSQGKELTLKMKIISVAQYNDYKTFEAYMVKNYGLDVIISSEMSNQEKYTIAKNGDVLI